MTLIPVSKISTSGDRSWKRRRIAVDRPALLDLRAVLLVDRIAEDVPDAAERDRADRHGDRLAGVEDVETAGEAVGRVHGDGAHTVVAEVLLDLRHELAVLPRDGDPQRVVDGWQRAAVEGGVDDDAADLDHLAAGRDGS